MTREPEGRERFDESRVRQIIRRAIDIDEFTANTIDLSELRHIAASVGISSDALDQALDEGRQAEKARARALKTLRRVRRVVTVVTAMVLGFTAKLLGALAGAEALRGLLLAGMVPLVVIVLMLALYNRVRGDQRTYQIDNAAIWAGFILTSSSLTSNPPGIPPGAMAWGALAILGVLIIGRRQSQPPRLSKERVVDRVLKFMLDRTDREGPTRRQSLPAQQADPHGGFGDSVPATP